MPQVKCKICQTEFYIKPSHQKLGYGKYCSKECLWKSQLKGKFVDCYICGKEVWKMPSEINGSKSKKYFCSKTCQTKWRNQFFSGTKHPNWKGGHHREYRKKLLASKRNLICETCGIKDKRVLVVHHKDEDRRNNNFENLSWLCLNCHYLVHHHNKKIK